MGFADGARTGWDGVRLLDAGSHRIRRNRLSGCFSMVCRSLRMPARRMPPAISRERPASSFGAPLRGMSAASMRCCTGSGGDSETKNGVKGMNEQSEPWKALPELPADVVAYSRTPDFTPETLPEAFKAAHTTKSGVWGVIHVLDGCLSYYLEPPHEGSKLVSAGET